MYVIIDSGTGSTHVPDGEGENLAPVTIRDVARKANVGVGTVSRVLNDSPKVSPETRARVLEAIDALDYVPNPVAQRLSRGRTQAISVILPFLTLPSYVERLRGVQRVLDYSDYDLVLYSADKPDRKDHLFQALSRSKQCDGVLAISLRPREDDIKRFVENGIPVVLVDTRHKDLPGICVDNVLGGEMAVEYLIGLGHRQIAFLSDFIISEFEFSAMRDRYLGYMQGLEKANINFVPDYHREAYHDQEAAMYAAMELLNLKNPPTAIFASSDIQAIGVLEAAQRLGVSVPEELSVIGFDGVRDAKYLNLTTIRQPLFESGVEGSRMLLRMIEDKIELQETIFQELKLIVRGTTAELNAELIS